MIYERKCSHLCARLCIYVCQMSDACGASTMSGIWHFWPNSNFGGFSVSEQRRDFHYWDSRDRHETTHWLWRNLGLVWDLFMKVADKKGWGQNATQNWFNWLVAYTDQPLIVCSPLSTIFDYHKPLLTVINHFQPGQSLCIISLKILLWGAMVTCLFAPKGKEESGSPKTGRWLHLPLSVPEAA